MKDSITSQLPDLISAHVQNSMMKWVSQHAPLGDAAATEKIIEIASENRRSFFDLVAPQVVLHYIAVFEENLVALREVQKNMTKASRRGESLMDFWIGVSPDLSSIAPKQAIAPEAAAAPPQPLNITLYPEFNFSMPAKKSIDFVRDETGKLTGAKVTES